jgi:two-component system, chemotaxis family, sensor kinase CheA
VLSRNQLIQRLSSPFSEQPEVERVIRMVLDAVEGYSRRFAENSGTDGAASADRQNEIRRLKQMIHDAFAFRLTDLRGVNGIVQSVDRVTSMMQENIMQTRMQPLSVVFSKFPRVVRDLSRKLDKQINLVQQGQDVELDKSIIEQLSDPLTHLIRNSASHGIEPSEERKRKGKDPVGQIMLRAFHEGGKVNIEIIDDGAGIDARTIKKKAIEKGLISEEAAEAMSERELQMLVFAPGLSTAAAVNDVSGRGVGMDVVKTNIERLGGSVDLQSSPGEGARFLMQLPLTLAIIPSLIVTAEGKRFAAPQVGLEEIVRIRACELTEKIEKIQNSEVLRLRGALLPLVRLADVLGIAPTYIDPATGERRPERRKRWSDRRHDHTRNGADTSEEEAKYKERRTGKRDRRESVRNAVKVLVLRTGKNLLGLVVDEVSDSEEIVVKPLSEYFKSCLCYSGATIMGDGKVAMILDPSGIASVARLDFSQIEESAEAERGQAADEIGKAREILLFNNDASEHFALPLSAIARIEKREESELESVGGKLFLKYDNAMIRVVKLHDYLPVSPPAKAHESIFVIVPKSKSRPIGIGAYGVDDVVQFAGKLDTENIRAEGIAGSLVLKNVGVTIMLDLPALLHLADPSYHLEPATGPM